MVHWGILWWKSDPQTPFLILLDAVITALSTPLHSFSLLKHLVDFATKCRSFVDFVNVPSEMGGMGCMEEWVFFYFREKQKGWNNELYDR